MSRKITAVVCTTLLVFLTGTPTLSRADTTAACPIADKFSSKCAVSATVVSQQPGTSSATHPNTGNPGAPTLRTECFPQRYQPTSEHIYTTFKSDLKGTLWGCAQYDTKNQRVASWEGWHPDNPDTPEQTPPTRDPITLVKTAIAELNMQAPKLGIVPKAGQGIIDFPVWLQCGELLIRWQ